MSDTYIQLPYTGTTSGDLLDGELVTVGANAVTRERMQITGAAATAIAPVSSSGGLLVTLSTLTGQIVSLSSGTVTLSSNPTVAISSGLISLTSGTVTLSSNPTVNVSSGIITLSSNPTVNISSGVVTLSSNPTVNISSGLITFSSAPTVNISSGVVSVLTSGTLTVTATSTGGLLVDPQRGVTLAFFNFTATSSGLKSLVAASGSNKVKLVSYVIVCNSTQEVAFYSSNTALGGSSSAPMVLSSYSGISAVGGRSEWLMETSAAGSLQVYLGNPGIVSGHGSYFYEV